MVGEHLKVNMQSAEQILRSTCEKLMLGRIRFLPLAYTTDSASLFVAIVIKQHMLCGTMCRAYVERCTEPGFVPCLHLRD